MLLAQPASRQRAFEHRGARRGRPMPTVEMRTSRRHPHPPHHAKDSAHCHVPRALSRRRAKPEPSQLSNLRTCSARPCKKRRENRPHDPRHKRSRHLMRLPGRSFKQRCTILYNEKENYGCKPSAQMLQGYENVHCFHVIIQLPSKESLGHQRFVSEIKNQARSGLASPC